MPSAKKPSVSSWCRVMLTVQCTNASRTGDGKNCQAFLQEMVASSAHRHQAGPGQPEQLGVKSVHSWGEIQIKPNVITR